MLFWIILIATVFGIFYFLYKKNTKKNADDSSSRESYLELERQSAVQAAKDGIYQDCFSRLIRDISTEYKNNRKNLSIWARTETSVSLDRDTIHKVLMKASCDAIKEVGLPLSCKPIIQIDRHGFRISISW